MIPASFLNRLATLVSSEITLRDSLEGLVEPDFELADSLIDFFLVMRLIFQHCTRN